MPVDKNEHFLSTGHLQVWPFWSIPALNPDCNGHLSKKLEKSKKQSPVFLKITFGMYSIIKYMTIFFL